MNVFFLENRTELARVGKGSCFGELALLRREKRAANVAAMTDAKVVSYLLLAPRFLCSSCCGLYTSRCTVYLISCF